MRRRTSDLWTEREDALICRLQARGKTLDEIVPKLPNRTRLAVGHRIRYLIKQGRIAGPEPWTAREDALIGTLREQGKTLDEIAMKLPHRTRKAVSARVRLLLRQGLVEPLITAELGRRPWTAREDARLIKLRARGATLREMANEVPHRTEIAIGLRVARLAQAGRVERLGAETRKAWSAEDDRRLARMRRTGKTMEEIAAALDRTLPSINGRIAQRVRRGELELQLPTPRSASAASDR